MSSDELTGLGLNNLKKISSLSNITVGFSNITIFKHIAKINYLLLGGGGGTLNPLILKKSSGTQLFVPKNKNF